MVVDGATAVVPGGGGSDAEVEVKVQAIVGAPAAAVSGEVVDDAVAAVA